MEGLAGWIGTIYTLNLVFIHDGSYLQTDSSKGSLWLIFCGGLARETCDTLALVCGDPSSH
jgi:hypothetical protein